LNNQRMAAERIGLRHGDVTAARKCIGHGRRDVALGMAGGKQQDGHDGDMRYSALEKLRHAPADRRCRQLQETGLDSEAWD
jgi:hypothetical protein